MESHNDAELCTRCHRFSSLINDLLLKPDPPEFVGDDYGDEQAQVILELEHILNEPNCRLCRLIRACVDEFPRTQLGVNERRHVRLLRQSFAYLRTRKQADYKEWRENSGWPDNTQYYLKRTARLSVTLLTLNIAENSVQRTQVSSRGIQLFATCSGEPPLTSGMSPGLISNITDDGQNVQFPNDSTLLEGRVVNQSGVDWSLVKLWINLCHDSHDPECYPQKLNVDNPFRVIDVNDLCLVQIDGEVEYAALSYVWGKREQLELKEGNYTQFHQSNAFADIKHRIPDTIKDAITACLKLDVKYLWVDALCIQQDSKDDKDRLIAIMDQVYAGAVLTLVAADGEDSWSGLHGVRPGTRIVQQTQERIQNLQFGTTAQDLNTILHQSKWSTRGWTFQEKVCSKRLLLFGKTQCLFWCNGAVFQEDTVLEVNSRHHMIELEQVRTGTDKYLRYNIEYRRDRMISDIPLSSYNNAVTAYVNRSLSFPDDAAKAFLGISKLLERLFGPLCFSVPEVAFGMCMSWHWINLATIGATLPESSQWSHKVSDSNRNPSFPSWSWLSWVHCSPFKSGLFMPIRGEHYPRFTYRRFDDIGMPIAIANGVFSTSEYLCDVYSVEDGSISAALRFQNYREEKRVPQIEIRILDGSQPQGTPFYHGFRPQYPNSETFPNGHWEIWPRDSDEPFRLTIFRREFIPYLDLLGFWARSHRLWVDRFTIDDDALYKAMPRDQLGPAVVHAFQADLIPDYGTYQIRREHAAESIGQVVLRRNWRDRSPDALQFVLIAADTKRADLLLLEWEFGIARRVGIVRGVKLESLKEVHSKLELIILG